MIEAIAIFDAGLSDAPAFVSFPLEHHRKIERRIPLSTSTDKIRRGTRSIGNFPSPEFALRVVTMILIEQSEEWLVERRYISPESLELVRQS